MYHSQFSYFSDLLEEKMTNIEKLDSADKNVLIFLGVVLVIIICYGVPINILTIKTLLIRTSRRWKLMDKVIISLCVCNLVEIFPLFVLNAAACFKMKWLYGETGCVIFAFWMNLTGNVSIWHLVVFAFEQRRCVSRNNIARPTWNFLSSWKQNLVLVLVWLQGFIWSVLPVIGWGSYGLEGLEISCAVQWERTDAEHLSYTMTLFAVNFVIPATLLVFCYVHIFQRFKGHVDQISPEALAIRAANQVKLRKLAKTSICMTVTFFFAWMPYAGVALTTTILQRKLPPMVASLPGVFAKCATVTFATIIFWKRSTFNRQEVNHAGTSIPLNGR